LADEDRQWEGDGRRICYLRQFFDSEIRQAPADFSDKLTHWHSCIHPVYTAYSFILMDIHCSLVSQLPLRFYSYYFFAIREPI
jgi:hypothetical protein